jgi:hypothetical protein
MLLGLAELFEVYINPEDFGKSTGDDSEILSLERNWRLLLHLATILRPFNQLSSVTSSERPVNRLNKCLIILFAFNGMLETLKEEAEKDNGMGHYSKGAKYGLRLLEKYLDIVDRSYLDIVDRSDLILSAHLLDPNIRAKLQSEGLRGNYSNIKKSVKKAHSESSRYYNAEGNHYPNVVKSLNDSEPSSPVSFAVSKRPCASVGSLKVKSKELSAFDKWSLKVLATPSLIRTLRRIKFES